jgi:hypothetical protein
VIDYFFSLAIASKNKLPTTPVFRIILFVLDSWLKLIDWRLIGDEAIIAV